MRTPLILLPLLLSLPSSAQAVNRRDSRTLTQAAYVLKRALPISPGKVEVLSKDRARLTGGNEGTVLVTRINHCSYSIMSSKVGGYKINFSRLYGTFEHERSAGEAQIVLPGNSEAGCILPLNGPDQCSSVVKLTGGDPQQETALLAGVTYLLDQGCRASANPGGKARF